MKLFNCIFLMIITVVVFEANLQAVDSVITFFIKEKAQKPKKANNKNTKFISKSLSQPSFINAIGKDRSWLDQPGVDGVQAVYGGYFATSDKNGQITFPRLQQNETIHLLVTPEIEAEFMMSPTLISHWITIYNRPTALYKISRKKHKGLKTYYFDVEKIEAQKDIPMNTIIIFAQPDHVHVPVGISLNTYSTNFVLPELEAHQVLTAKNSLYTLSIKQYFEQINIERQNDSPSIATMVTNQ